MSLQIKRQTADWQVTEDLGFEFSGSGQHTCFFVKKNHLNTLDVVDALARVLNVPPVEIGYAGRKDKFGITRQWFSVPRNLTEWPLHSEQLVCEAQATHHQKLRVGSLRGNAFKLRVYGPSSSQCALQQVMRGFANGFGPQRVNQSNIDQARAWLAKPRQ